MFNVRTTAVCSIAYSICFLIFYLVTDSPIFMGLIVGSWLVCIFCIAILSDEKERLKSKKLERENASCLFV